MTVRVRFAPSPTGALTIGGLRSSLFNYLFARHTGGVYILRIEDTDRTRLTPGSLEALLDAHRWLGLDWDEGPDVGGAYGPYFQSERLDLYQRKAEELIAGGHAYRCYCSEQRLESVRQDQRRRGVPTGYDRRCRDLSPEERREQEAAGIMPVVRFKMPLTGETTLHDPVRGTITWQNKNYDDHVLLKSDGFPTSHLSAIVDDIEMRISHAFRAEEWLPSTPRHLLTFRALGAEPPIYAHLPLIVGKDRKKLSKRHGDTAVTAYAKAGYLPDAMFNFLGLIGWSLDDHSVIIPRETFIEHFTLDRITRNPALFDADKLNWINEQYWRALSDEAIAGMAAERLNQELPPNARRPVSPAEVARMTEALRTRVTRLDQIVPLSWYLFVDGPLDYDTTMLLGRKGAGDPAAAAAMLRLVRDALAGHEPWDGTDFEALLRGVATEKGVKFGPMLAPVRVALTGSSVSLPIDTTLAMLGKERALARLDDALGRLGAS
jgi:glutamyl-tRNA synthetase